MGTPIGKRIEQICLLLAFALGFLWSLSDFVAGLLDGSHDLVLRGGLVTEGDLHGTELLAGGELGTFEVHTLHVTEALLHFREAALFTDETVHFQAYFSSLNTDHRSGHSE